MEQQPPPQQGWGQQPPPQPAWAQQQPAPAGTRQTLDLSNVTWPIPATWLQMGPFKTLIEPTIAAVVHILGGLFLLWAAHSVFAELGRLGDVPGQAVLLVLAVLGSFLLVVFGLLKTGHWLLRMDPVGRPMVLFWAGAALFVGMIDGMPGWLFVIALVLAVLGAALYLSPACRAAFAEKEAVAERPAPIAFSLTLITAQLILLGMYLVGLIPMLGNVGDMNRIGAFVGEGSVGTQFAFGVLLLAATTVGTYIAFSKIRARDASGRLIITGIAVLGTIAFFLASGAIDEAEVSSLLVVGGLALWAAILVPLWWGHTPARWFGVKPIGVAATPPQQ